MHKRYFYLKKFSAVENKMRASTVSDIEDTLYATNGFIATTTYYH